MPSLVAEACTVLGIEPGPSGTPPDDAVIASAFKKLAVRWHPDRNPENVKEATQRFAEISAARDLLVDPPTNSLREEPVRREGAGGDPYPKSSHSQNLRTFEGDVTEQIASGALGGDEAVGLFEGFALWAVWKCNRCNAVCCRIRKNKYSCMCGHRLREHDAGHGFRCSVPKCPCKRYEFMVQDTDQPHKCRCKHRPQDHDPLPPYRCQKCDCEGFDSPWTCNCGHKPSEHSTCFVRHKYTERTREWVAGGLRGECVAMAKRFRGRSAAERASFIQRANAAKAAGFPSWKAMQREAALHAQHETSPASPGVPHANGAGPGPAHAAASANGSGERTDESGSTSGEHGEERSTAAAGAAVPASFTAAVGVTAAGFHPSNETTLGMASEELRERLAEAGVGIRTATAAGLGAPGLW